MHLLVAEDMTLLPSECEHTCTAASEPFVYVVAVCGYGREERADCFRCAIYCSLHGQMCAEGEGGEEPCTSDAVQE